MNATALGRHADEPTPSSEGPDDAGRLIVAERVVEKVAGFAVMQVPDAAAAPHRVLGFNVGEARPEDTAGVRAEVQDEIASVRATIAVRWPRSVQEVAEEVRRRIRHEVTSQTGVRVDHVDVDVVSLTFPESAEPRVR